MRGNIRGFGLAAVLIVALVLATLLTTLIGANTSTLAVVRHSEGTQIAQSAAESLLSRAIYELKRDPSYGCMTDGECLSFAPPGSDSGQAVLTFDPAEAARLGIPVSVNNLDNGESILGANGEMIPARTARVVAVGSYRSERRTVVMDLHIPPYPYAVATDGTFESLGDLTLTGISPENGEEIPGHLLANSNSESSLSLGPRTMVSGDLVSVGGIVLADEDMDIRGEVRPNSKPTEVPRIDIAQFDPRNLESPGAVTELPSSFYSDPTLEGKVLREGNLMLSGRVNLDGALLFVDGDVEITGELNGRGAVVATGHLTVNGTQSLTTDNELALLVGGDLSICGRGVNSSKLEGLIYSEGNVEVRDSTIQGTLISHSNGGTSPQVVVERASLVHDEEATDFQMSVSSAELRPSVYLAFNAQGMYTPEANTECEPEALEDCLVAVMEVTTESIASLGDGSGSVSTTSESTALARASAPPSLPSELEMLYIGATVDGKGDYLVFPPDGSEPLSARTELGAMLKLAGIILEEKPELIPEGDSQIPWDDLGVAVQALSADLKGLTSLEEAEQSDSQVESVEQFDLEIDPMKFLKYGEQMRIRAIRVVETSPSLI